jgi:glycosidase
MVFMVPLEFWNWVIPMVKRDYPDTIFIGEIYNVAEYRPFLEYGHFDYLYDKVNLYDTLVNIERHNYSAAQLTGCWQTVDGIGDKMVNFLENHDEVRFGSVEFSGNPASVIPSLVVSTMMSKSPFLLYYGQELGERATDNEGFAGNNNRSTIFDYWSYGTLRRWYSNGKCDGAIMTPQEKWLRSVYQKVLSLCNTNKALSKGSFYDLMYVNLQNDHFNPHRNFAFLRHVKGELLLIVANFGNEAVELDINIPIDAFNFLNLPQLKNVKAIDLLTGTPQLTSLVADSPTRVNVEAKNAVVLQITYKKRKADTTKK